MFIHLLQLNEDMNLPVQQEGRPQLGPGWGPAGSLVPAAPASVAELQELEVVKISNHLNITEDKHV